MCHGEVRDHPKKKTTRRSKAPSVEIERETCEDGHELMYRELEQEVKDAEPKKAQRPRKKAAEAEATTAAAAQAVVMVAAAALTAVADGKTISSRSI